MWLISIIVALWAVLMLRSVMAEYRYYQAVKQFEPEIWQQLGAPKGLKIPMVFVSKSGRHLLENIDNYKINQLATHHRQAGRLFLGYVMLVLMASIVFFKLA
ncbi:hypothetical protein [Shewanella waksmanii]|uniref:hypothetical protein n=1 Tax=Shewanella waksmanii TaxID=213783 RepID=UPI003736CE83